MARAKGTFRQLSTICAVAWTRAASSKSNSALEGARDREQLALAATGRLAAMVGFVARGLFAAPRAWHACCFIGLPESEVSLLAIRERALESGVHDLGDAELLTLLLGTGSSGHNVERVALSLLQASGGIEGIARLGPQAFVGQPGVGPVKAARLAAAMELGRRVLIRSLDERRQIIDCFEAAAEWARPRLAALDHEEVWLLCLDGRSGLKASLRIAQGGLHGCALTARDVLAPAVKNGAAAILLIHNHPSGDPQPSPDDVEMTKHVAKCAELIGIPLLDHVVVARSGARSVLDERV